VIPSRRFASVAGDQGVPAYEEAMREWEVQLVASPPRPTFTTVQEITKPHVVKIEETHAIQDDDDEDSAGDE
jgi:hypothetical protein